MSAARLPHRLTALAEAWRRENAADPAIRRCPITTLLESFVGQLYPGEIQQVLNLAVAPLLAPEDRGPEFLTLATALGNGVLTITEVAEGGMVPELRVANRGPMPVLLLDGEELAGAKQNRALNTTILLPPESETIIPVSCTEHGRWRYTSREFSDSGHLMSSKIRKSKQADVRASLARERSFRSDQGKIWHEIDELREQTGAASPTGAMRDTYEARATDLQTYLDAVTCLPRQVGLLAFVNGRVVGVDALSRAGAYEQLHARLIRSYAMDALVAHRQRVEQPTLAAVQAFLEAASRCSATVYPSVGCGEDHRFLCQSMVGSALAVAGTVVHAAFFTMDEADIGEPWTGRLRGRRPLPS